MNDSNRNKIIKSLKKKKLQLERSFYSRKYTAARNFDDGLVIRDDKAQPIGTLVQFFIF